MRTQPPLVLSAALALCGACSRPSEPAGTHASPSEPSAHPAASADNRPAVAATAPSATPPSAASARELEWTDPAGWQRVASESRMRKATYKIPAVPKDTDDGEMAVFHFRGEGGSTEANIQRWIGQFPDAKPADVKRSQRNVGGMNQTIVEVEGTYASGMPGASGAPSTPKAGYRLIGAVVETPAGPYFFKLTGPKKTVESARGAFMTMLDSVKSS